MILQNIKVQHHVPTVPVDCPSENHALEFNQGSKATKKKGINKKNRINEKQEIIFS